MWCDGLPTLGRCCCGESGKVVIQDIPNVAEVRQPHDVSLPEIWAVQCDKDLDAENGAAPGPAAALAVDSEHWRILVKGPSICDDDDNTGAPFAERDLTPQQVTEASTQLLTRSVRPAGAQRTDCAIELSSRALAVFTVLLSVAVWVKTLVAFFGVGAIAGENEYLQKSNTFFAVAGLVAQPITAGPTVWLLMQARTRHLRQVAVYLWLNWLSNLAGTLFTTMSGPLWLETAVFWVADASWKISYLVFVGLVIIRLRALECRTLSSRSLRLLLWPAVMFWMFETLIPNLVLQCMRATAGAAEASPGAQSFCADVLSPWSKRILSLVMWLSALCYVGFGLAILSGLRSVHNEARAAAVLAPGRFSLEAARARKAISFQMWGVFAGVAATTAKAVASGAAFSVAWPLPEIPDNPNMVLAILFTMSPVVIDTIANVFAGLAFSGAFSGAVAAGVTAAQAEESRQECWKRAASAWCGLCSTNEDNGHAAWQAKVEELAGRGLTLDALLGFYRSLGISRMPSFDPLRHTTHDVVKQAIIPESCAARTALAPLLMGESYTRPMKMVTHNWANLFTNLVAAVVADAVGEQEFSRIAYLLRHDVARLQSWVEAVGVGSMTYWVCALSVNQHLGICDQSRCNCGLPKAMNDTQPTLLDGRSIECEMNKFDDVMRYLSATDPSFSQVVAVDGKFQLFNRAWCVSEIAAARSSGMPQKLKLYSAESLSQHEERLRAARIQDMEASRPEDKLEILSRIPDPDSFNAHMQRLLFKDLLPAWRDLDATEQMLRARHVAWWMTVAREHEDLWQATAG